ncbi:MAG TPA: hypothetical protein VNW52_04870 [Burkholderiaceae bacterium]|nr:hypothetical protein [Burkholderiaceae bacterium]
MQFAMASYVCPGMMAGNDGAAFTASSVGTNHQNMVECKGMDKAQVGLCHAHAHDQASKQSLDKPNVPDVAAFVPASLVLVVTTIDDAAYLPAISPTSLLLTRTTAPPIAIQNCCFRI